jgi:hypothetical protein
VVKIRRVLRDEGGQSGVERSKRSGSGGGVKGGGSWRRVDGCGG